MHHAYPAVDLDPGEESAEMKALHLLFGRDEHHVTGRVHIAAVAEVQLVEQGDLPAAVIPAGGGSPVLGAAPAAAVVVPAALASVGTVHASHLFRQQDLVEIVHFLIGAAVVITEIEVLVQGAGRVHLKALHAKVNERLQVVHPVLLTGRGGTHEGIFLYYGSVVFLADPQPEMIAEGIEFSDEKVGIVLFGILFLTVERFRGELVVIPTLLGREIVVFVHPLGLQPEDIARDVMLPEAYGIRKDIPLVLTHLRAEAETVSPFGEQIVASGQKGVGVEDIRHRSACHKVKIRLRAGRVDIQAVLLRRCDVKIALAGGIVVDTPAAGAHHKRHRNLCHLICGPHPEDLAAMLDVLARGAAATIEPLVFP